MSLHPEIKQIGTVRRQIRQTTIREFSQRPFRRLFCPRHPFQGLASEILIHPEFIQVFHQFVLVISEKRLILILEIVRQCQYIQLIQRHQFIQQKQVQRAAFETGGFVQLTVGTAVGIRPFRPANLLIDKTHQRLFYLIAGSILRQLTFHRILDSL